MIPAANLQAISYIQNLTADPYPFPDYQVCRSPRDVYDYIYAANHHTPFHRCTEHPNTIALAEDTESLPNGDPYCLTFCLRPGTGRLIYKHDAATLNYYRDAMNSQQWGHLYHNWLHDADEYDLSIKLSAFDLPYEPFVDTMVRAYNLCLGGGGDDDQESRAGRGSLGLKQLAFRHLNMRMRSFKDTVYPHSSQKLLPWLQTVIQQFTLPEPPPRCICGCLTELHKRNLKGNHTGGCTECSSCTRHKKGKPDKHPDSRLYGYLIRKSKNLIEAIHNNALEDTHYVSLDPNEETDEDEYKFVDPWKRIKSWHPHDHRFINEAGLSGYPRASVADVPEPELLHYACRDADATLRLYLHLQTLKPWLFYGR